MSTEDQGATTPTVNRVFDVLVVGGGNAGVSAAARLLRKDFTDVGLIEPHSVHTYRPLLSYVGGGQATLNDAERTQRSVIPRGCTWLRDSATTVDPTSHVVTTASGARYGYRDLVLGTGLMPDAESLPGLDAALDSDAVSSNYVHRAEKTWELVQSMRPGGHAVFTVPRAPVSCTGTTLKPLFLAAAHWKRVGRLSSVDLTLVVDREQILGVPKLDAVLLSRLADLNVSVHTSTSVSSIDPVEKQLTVDKAGHTDTLDYDFLHLVPPFRGQTWLRGSGLTDDAAHGLVDVDPTTFRHLRHDDVWAIGDGATLDTDPSGGGLRRQVKILVDNMASARAGRPLSSYDGYTVAPVTVDGHTLVAGEFDRTGTIQSSLPSFLDPLKPRRSAWLFDRYALPRTYWYSILRGRV